MAMSILTRIAYGRTTGIRSASTFSNILAGIKSLGGKDNSSVGESKPVTISNNGQQEQEPPRPESNDEDSIKVIGIRQRKLSKPSTLSTRRWKSKYKADTPELITGAIQLVVAQRLGLYNNKEEGEELIVIDGPDKAQDLRGDDIKIDYNEPRMSKGFKNDDKFAKQVEIFLSKRGSINLPNDWINLDIESKNLTDRFNFFKSCQQYTGRLIPDVIQSRSRKICDVISFYMNDLAKSKTYHEFMPGKIDLDALSNLWKFQSPNIKIIQNQIPTKRVDKERLKILNNVK